MSLIISTLLSFFWSVVSVALISCFGPVDWKALLGEVGAGGDREGVLLKHL